jgi:hypothetical protein
VKLQHRLDRVAIALRRALCDERSADVGHEGVADEKNVVFLVENEERVFGLAARCSQRQWDRALRNRNPRSTRNPA